MSISLAGCMDDRTRTASRPKPGLVREGILFTLANILMKISMDLVLVCKEWLVLEDGALAHQLQDQESMLKFLLSITHLIKVLFHSIISQMI